MKHVAVKQHVYPLHQQNPSKSNVLDHLIFSTRPPHSRSLGRLLVCQCNSTIFPGRPDTSAPRSDHASRARLNKYGLFEGFLEKVSSLLKEHDSLTLKTASEQIKWLHYPQLALTHSMWP